MIRLIPSLRFCQACAVMLFIVLTTVACQPTTVTYFPTPMTLPSEVTRDVIQQVTRTVIPATELPLTVTPTLTPSITLAPSLTSTFTRTPTVTPTPEPPVITILVHAACNFGPGGAYLWKYGLLETSWMEVIGQNWDGSWLFVQGVHGWNPCWVKADFVQFNDGGNAASHNIQIVPTDIILPFATNLYLPPDGVQAFRYGNEVKIFWNAVCMTEDDYEGYLIEAWLCQAGVQVFQPIKSKPPLNENVDTLVLSVIDDPGCQAPSHARIYTAEKHGYTGFIQIPWSAYESIPSPTP
jgi:hypothetical protein